ncbi:MAG: glycosyltransferase family 2 protein [Rhodobacterales bacterium]|nr:glycosyltransferase family 2 protein [Rhodobacterales bacterium]
MTFVRQTSPQGTLLVVSTMKDEGPYVLEWVAHHLAAGFTDVLVYTNDCTDGTDKMLKRLQALDIGVQHRNNAVPEGVKPQPAMLKLAADEPMLREADWVLILDADEFLCVNHPSGTLDGMVAELDAMQAQALVLTWRVFGSGGIQDWSRAPVTDQFTRAAPEFWNKGWGTKTLFRYDPIYLRPGIHRPIIKSQHKDTGYPDSLLWVNGSGRPLDTWFKLRGWRSIRRTLGYDWGQVNHYAIKSMDAYALRKLRGNVNLKADKYNFDYWALQDRNEVEDLRIQRHRDRRDQILAWFLQDPKLRKLHDTAVAGVEARLADHRTTQAYADLVAGLKAASQTPISEVIAKPPKARDRKAIAALDASLE